jgi:hypothetical protein
MLQIGRLRSSPQAAFVATADLAARMSDPMPLRARQEIDNTPHAETGSEAQ